LLRLLRCYLRQVAGAERDQFNKGFWDWLSVYHPLINGNGASQGLPRFTYTDCSYLVVIKSYLVSERKPGADFQDSCHGQCSMGSSTPGKRYLIVYNAPHVHFRQPPYSIYNPSTNCRSSRYVQLASTITQ
jgi:hypothetical protein